MTVRPKKLDYLIPVAHSLSDKCIPQIKRNYHHTTNSMNKYVIHTD